MSLQKEIRITADLLNISITDEEEKSIATSFEQLLEYFSVMNKVVLNEDTSYSHAETNGALRTKDAVQYSNTENLIKRSEEHEDNYIIIPNVL